MKTSEKLNHLANYLDGIPDERFNFNHWGDGCGTVCCAAGHIAEAFPDDEEAQKTWVRSSSCADYWLFSPSQAAAFLGLDTWRKARKSDYDARGYSDFDRMFTDADGRLFDENFDIPKSTVAARLRRLAKYSAKMGR